MGSRKSSPKPKPRARARCEGTTKAGTRCRSAPKRGERLCAAHLGVAHRDLKLTDDVVKRIVDAVRAGNYASVAAQAAGISESTFYRWLEQGQAQEQSGEAGAFREFRESITRAGAEAEVQAVALLRRAMAEDSRAIVLWLERRFPDRWRRRVEHTGPEGGPIAAEIVTVDARERSDAAREYLRRVAGD